MTSKRDDYELNLTATDKASPVVDGLADKVDKLPDKADVELTAQDKASDEITQLRQRPRRCQPRSTAPSY